MTSLVFNNWALSIMHHDVFLSNLKFWYLREAQEKWAICSTFFIGKKACYCFINCIMTIYTMLHKLTLVLLNKLRCHTHFLFSADQMTWSRLLIHIHEVNDKQCRSRSVGFYRSQLIWIYTVCKDRVYPDSGLEFYQIHQFSYFCEFPKICLFCWGVYFMAFWATFAQNWMYCSGFSAWTEQDRPGSSVFR